MLLLPSWAPQWTSSLHPDIVVKWITENHPKMSGNGKGCLWMSLIKFVIYWCCLYLEFEIKCCCNHISQSLWMKTMKKKLENLCTQPEAFSVLLNDFSFHNVSVDCRRRLFQKYFGKIPFIFVCFENLSSDLGGKKKKKKKKNIVPVSADKQSKSYEFCCTRGLDRCFPDATDSNCLAGLKHCVRW